MQTKLRPIQPPRAPELEQRTLAALVQIGNPNELRVQQAMLKLDKECFSTKVNIALYDLIRELYEREEHFNLFDLVTSAPDELYATITNWLNDDYVSLNHLEHDIEKLIAFRTHRKQIKILVDAVNNSLDAITPHESLEIITSSLQELNRCNDVTRKTYLRSYETIADEFLSKETIDDSQIIVDIHGMPSIPNRALITIAGRSGHGKTFFALHLMDKLIDALPNKQTLYFNLEMDERVMMERHATLLGVRGNSRKEKIKNGISLLLPKNVSLISQPMITIDEIETESRLAAMRQPIGVIVVDYLGLVRSKSRAERKDLEQNDIAKRLAALSLELNCVVIALSQVNRDFKSRPIGDRCPQISDAAEAMGSVHSSSLWLGIDQPQADTDDPEYRDLFLVACRKNRGDSGLFNLRLKFKNGMFSKWEKAFSQSYKKTEPVGF